MRSIILAIAFTAAALSARAQTTNIIGLIPGALSWDANKEPDISGYVATISQGPTQIVRTNVGKVTSVPLGMLSTNLVSGEAYVFSVQAMNTAGLLSDPSSITNVLSRKPDFVIGVKLNPTIQVLSIP